MIHKQGKIYVNDEAESIIIQEELFNRGYNWGSSVQKVKYTTSPHLYWDGRNINMGGSDYYFDNQQFILHTIEDFKKEKGMSEIKITKERILEAAKGCSQAKPTLKTLFPEVFKDDKYINIPSNCGRIHCNGGIIIERRSGGDYGNKGFYLGKSVNWEIVKDSAGYNMLLPTKKR